MHWLADSSWEPYPLFNHPNHYTSPNTFSLVALSMSAMPALWECSSLVLISPVASWPAWQLCLQPSAPLHFSQGHWAWDPKRGQSPRSTWRSPGINERLPDTARKITLDVIGFVRSAWYIPTIYDNLTVFLGIWMNALKITERNQGMHLPGNKDLLTANFIFSWSCHVSNFGPRRLEIWMPLFLASCFLQPCNHPLHECRWHFTIITYLPPSLRIYLPRPSYRPHFLQVFSAWKTSLAFLWSKL